MIKKRKRRKKIRGKTLNTINTSEMCLLTLVSYQVWYYGGTIFTLLGLQSPLADNWGQTTWNQDGLSPKREWSSKGVNLNL